MGIKMTPQGLVVGLIEEETPDKAPAPEVKPEAQKKGKKTTK